MRLEMPNAEWDNWHWAFLSGMIRRDGCESGFGAAGGDIVRGDDLARSHARRAGYGRMAGHLGGDSGRHGRTVGLETGRRRDRGGWPVGRAVARADAAVAAGEPLSCARPICPRRLG